MQVKARHACPKCGSSDNLIEWSDGHMHCFTGGCNYHVFTGGKIMKESDTVKNFSPIKLQAIRLPNRKLLKSTCAKYGIGVYNKQIHFPYYDKGKVVGYKVRNFQVPKKDKRHFYIKGSITNILFGNQCVHNKKVIAITAGEFDAMALYQMTNVTGISLSCDNVAERAIKYNLEWIESFEKIILCIDNDESGQEAADIIASITRPYQTYRMVFPGGYKDANQMLMSNEKGSIDLFTRAFWSSRAVPIKTVFSFNELSLELETNYEVPKGIPTSISTLDKYLGGLRPGELTSIIAKTSVGKSTFVRTLMSNIIRDEHKCLLLALEEKPVSYTRRLLQAYIRRPLISVKPDERKFLIAEMLKHLIVSKLNGQTDINEVLKCIEYGVRLNNIKLAVLDNITSAVDSTNLYSSTTDYVNKLSDISKELNIHIIIVCHAHRGSETSIESGHGSGAIERTPDNIITLDREDTDVDEIAVKLIKNRELGIGNLRRFNLIYNSNSGIYEQNRANNIRQLPSRENRTKQETRRISNKSNGSKNLVS